MAAGDSSSILAKEPPPADILDWMEDDYGEIRRNGGGMGGPATLDRQDMDYSLKDRGISDPDERRVLRRVYYIMDRALRDALEQAQPKKVN